MYQIKVYRDLFFDQQASLGTCYVYDDNGKLLFKSESLERGWVNNQNRVSCIPTGIYPVKLEWSERFKKDLWEIYDVPGRSECKFHSANYWYQLNGCIALGNQRKHIDGDAIMDVTSSRATMAKFHEALHGQTQAILEVKNAYSPISI